MKFCPNCGAELADDADFCGACGTKMEASAPEVDPAKVVVAPETKKVNTKLIVLAAIAVVAVVAIVLIIKAIAGGAYKKPIKTLVNNYNNRVEDSAKYSELTVPKFMQKAADDILSTVKKGFEDSDEYDEFFEDEVGDLFADFTPENKYEGFDDKYGDDWKITYEIKDVEKIKKKDLKNKKEDLADIAEELENYEDPDDIEDLVDTYSDWFGYDVEFSDSDYKKLANAVKDLHKQCDKVDISEGYEVEVRLKIKGEDDHDSTTKTFNVYKINGDWLIDSTSLYF